MLRAKVAVFVDLYRKNRQLRRQAELLAERVAGLADPEVVEDVAAHVTTVEEAVGREDLAGITAAVKALRQRVDALRKPE